MAIARMYVALTVGAIIAVLFSVGFFTRSYKTFLGKEPNLVRRIIIYIMSIGVGVICMDIYGIGTILVMYWFIPHFILTCINWVIRKKSGERYVSCWKKWRLVYGSGLLPITFMAIMVGYGSYNMYHVVKEEYFVTSEKLEAGEKYKIALVADIHYGTFYTKNFVEKKCKEISKQNIDILLLGGDIVDENTSKEKMEEIFSILSKIETKYGIYYVYGNHDRQEYVYDTMYTEKELEQTISKYGIVILKDELYRVNEDLLLVGREDISKEVRASIGELLSEAGKDSYIVSMDHQPVEYKESAKSGVDLLLSGHTHAGQVWPINYLIKGRNKEGFYGYKKVGDSLHTIVTSGFGGWAMGVRTVGQSEYVIVNVEGSK